MIWFVLTAIVLLAVPLFFPVELEVDTRSEQYQVRWKRVFGVRALPGEKGWNWFYRILFFEKEWHPSKRDQKPAPPKEKPGRKRVLSTRQVWRLIKKCLASFQVKRFYINWDTNDFIANAYLYPLTHTITKNKFVFQVNFNGKRDVDILLQVRPVDLLLAFLAVYFIEVD